MQLVGVVVHTIDGPTVCVKVGFCAYFAPSDYTVKKEENWKIFLVLCGENTSCVAPVSPVRSTESGSVLIQAGAARKLSEKPEEK